MSGPGAVQVRPAVPADAPQMLGLMLRLAKFERYAEAFAVTEESLLAHGFGEERLFTAFVAEHSGAVAGLAVTYIVPWTYTLRPRLILKELYVLPHARGLGIGAALFRAASGFARDSHCDQLAWTVMSGNVKAEAFYRSLGGMPDTKWQGWKLDI